MAAGYESKEYDRLKARNFRPYSAGHRAMYEIAIAAIKAGGAPVKIVEAGFGIGWGLEQMVSAGIIATYDGCEPNGDSFRYTLGQQTIRSTSIFLWHTDFLSWATEARWGSKVLDAPLFYDEAFCIEVIEHVPLGDQLEFLVALRALSKRLWFSTPDKERVPKEGVRTDGEWRDLLREAGFTSIKTNTKHWTTLHECV